MTMIEKVARAICRAGICGPREHLNEQENAHWRKFELDARAAIAAMREPTEAMLGAEGVGQSADHVSHIDREPKHYWTLMIDAALGE